MRHGGQTAVDAGAEPTISCVANDFERALKEIKTGRQDRQRNQRRDAAAREHAIIDLQHVETSP